MKTSEMQNSMIILAHSLGNMVVCSAIQDHGLRPDRYFMLTAAVPAEAFDATQWNTAETDNPFEFEDWVGYPSNSWASCWHSLFPTNDIRSRLTWKGRFADVPQLTSLFNYYSTGDEVLSIYDTPDPGGSGKITIHPFGLGGKRYHSWQKQERFKGRWLQSALGGFAGTSEMGWGFEAFGHWTNGTPPMYDLADNPRGGAEEHGAAAVPPRRSTPPSAWTIRPQAPSPTPTGTPDVIHTKHREYLQWHPFPYDCKQ